MVYYILTRLSCVKNISAVICVDANPVHMGPEAGNLITALQEFISSIVAGSQRAIEVNLDEGTRR